VIEFIFGEAVKEDRREMPGPKVRLSDSDIRFLIETVAPQLLSRFDVVKNDTQLIEGMLDQEVEKVFDRIASSEERVMTSVSPAFLFEVLLRKAARDLRAQSYTIEKTGFQKVPVFDAREVVDFLSQEGTVQYLADMLASFTKVRSFAVAVRVRKGIWRRFRFSDMDVDSLIKFCEGVDDEHRFALYKRTADLCLFILGMFPEYVTQSYQFPLSADVSHVVPRRLAHSAEDYEEIGRRFYKLASSHRDAELLGLAEVLCRLHEKFTLARKPLIYISENLLKSKKRKLFPSVSSN
jgi:hypothetical protein